MTHLLAIWHFYAAGAGKWPFWSLFWVIFEPLFWPLFYHFGLISRGLLESRGIKKGSKRGQKGVDFDPFFEHPFFSNPDGTPHFLSYFWILGSKKVTKMAKKWGRFCRFWVRIVREIDENFTKNDKSDQKSSQIDPNRPRTGVDFLPSWDWRIYG